MRSLIVCALLFASPLAADCIANGHYTLEASPFPYTEDLTRPNSAPVHDGLWVGDTDEWTLIQTACSDATNINASTDVTLLVRGSFRIGRTTAAPDATFDVQLRVDGEAIATHSRRIGDQLPKSYRFGGSVQRLGTGNHLLTMWLRLRDPGKIFIGLQWITAQGAPALNAAGRAEVESATLGRDWTPVGLPLSFRSGRTIDAALQASFTVARAASPMTFTWSLDGEAPEPRTGVIAAPEILPDGVTLFDHRGAIERGDHTLQLWGRADDGAAELEAVTIELVGFPRQLSAMKLPELAESESNETTLVTTAGDERQPLAMSPVCGRWTKLLELDLPASYSTYSWTLDGYIELLAHDISGYGQIGMEVESGGAQTDVGIFEIQLDQQHDGIYFYGDCSKWSPADGAHVSLWIRRIDGCGVGAEGGSFLAGRRWLAVKLLPSQAPHLP